MPRFIQLKKQIVPHCQKTSGYDYGSDIEVYYNGNPQCAQPEVYTSEVTSRDNAMDRKLLFIPLILFLLLVVALLVQLKRNAGGEDPTMLESALVGKPVPTFQLASLDHPGKTVDQSVLRSGKPILFNVWATWCPTCRAEHEYLNKLAAQGIRIIGLNYKDDRDQAVLWLKQLGNPYAISLYDVDGMLGLDLGVYGAPETFLIDGDGIIRYRHAGDVNERVWQQTLLPLYRKYQERE